MQQPFLNQGDVEEIIVNGNISMKPVLQCIGELGPPGAFGERVSKQLGARAFTARAAGARRAWVMCAHATRRPHPTRPH
jgi:hypothetical protein